MAIVRANKIVPMLAFGHAIVNKPCYYNLLRTFLLTIVNGFEDTPAPTAIALDPIPVSALIRSGMA